MTKKTSISILDCTLRDGGRPFDCNFSSKNISRIINGLNKANIDYIELGFLRDKSVKDYSKDKTFFNTIEEAERLVSKIDFSEYTLFIDCGLYDVSKLSSINLNSKITNIRYAFTKKDFNDSLSKIIGDLKTIKAKGYNIFLQPINALSYSKKELSLLIKIANKYRIESFAIVDTYGSMYINDLKNITRYLDKRLHKNINILFHSHNSYQLSFALSQAFINMVYKRKIIIDSTLSGIGKCAGNLPTELICNYLNFRFSKSYNLNELYKLNDEIILKYKNKYDWGYNQYTLIQGIHKVHPNNIIYLKNKKIDLITVDRILSKLNANERLRYFYDVLDKLIKEENDNDCS